MELDVITLATVAGASAAAIVVTNFAKQLFALGRAGTRRTALITGFLIVEGATIAQNWDRLDTDTAAVAGALALAAVVGAQAGLAANAGFDTVKTGADYEVYPSGENVSGDED